MSEDTKYSVTGTREEPGDPRRFKLWRQISQWESGKVYECGSAEEMFEFLERIALFEPVKWWVEP